MAEVRFLGLVEVAEKPSYGHGRRRIPGGQALQRLLAKLAADALFRVSQEKAPLAAPLHPAVELLPQGFQQPGLRPGAVVQDGLGGGEAAQLVDDMLHPLITGKGGQVGLAGGDVAEGRRRGALVEVDAAEEVGGLVVQARDVGDGAGGDDADDIPLDKALGSGGVLHLLTDGHLVALGNQAGDVGLACVIGNPAHGNPLLGGLCVLAVVPGSKGQIQLPGGGAGVLVKHLVEIAQAEE